MIRSRALRSGNVGFRVPYKDPRGRHFGFSFRVHLLNQWTRLSDTMAVVQEDKRYQYAKRLGHTQEEASPVQAQGRVHRGTGERQDGAHYAPDDCITRQSGSGILSIRVSQIVAGVYEQGSVASSEWDSSQNGYNPVHVGGRGPREHNLADGQKDSAYCYRLDGGFWRHSARFGVFGV